MVTGIEVKGNNQFDHDWVDLVMALQNSEGQSVTHFVSIPTTARNSFMFGSKKSLIEYTKLEKLLLGFGIKLEYSTAINQIAQLFDNPAETFIGKQVTIRLGYSSNYIKYAGKDNGVTQYVILDKTGAEVVPLKFAGYEAAEQYAKENSIKLQGFIRALEVIPGEVATISLVASDSSLPF